MAITKKDVIAVANLCRIGLDESEINTLTSQLDKIIEFIDKLKELDVEKIPPTSHVLSLSNVFRKDENRPSLEPSQVLKNAPNKKDNFFKVPQVIE